MSDQQKKGALDPVTALLQMLAHVAVDDSCAYTVPVFDGKRGFWFSDLGKVYGRQMDRGALYYARTDGSLIKEAAFPIITPNGVGLSPDGSSILS